MSKGSKSRRWIRTLGAALAMLVVPALACDEPAFACEQDADCSVGRGGGFCEAEGYCSFAESQCASGRAWGDLSPAPLANKCVPLADDANDCDTAGCATVMDDQVPPPDRLLPGPQRDEPSDPSGESPELPRQRPDLAHCKDDVRNQGESDVDCGGDCDACAWCDGCFDDADCGEGTCEAGRCRTIEVMTIDWTTDCGSVADFTPKLVVPPGTYLATALPSAGSRWSHDDAVGGLTWQWRIDCNGAQGGGASFGNLRTPGDVRYATPEDAFAALVTDRTLVQLEPDLPTDEGDPSASSLVCGFADTYCDDNRGSVAVQVENWCP